MLRIRLCALGIVLLVGLSAGFLAGDAATTGAGEGNGVQAQGHFGGIYRLPLLNNPGTLDPAYAHDIYAGAVVHQVFDGLVQFSRDLFVIPAIAEDWRLEDGGRTYRFTLRKAARFHDGSFVTARDVIFSLSRLLRVTPAPTILPHLLQISGAKAYHEGQANEVAGLETPDPGTVILRLDQPYVPILAALGMYQASIVPESKAGNAEAFARRPVGSGPFRFDLWEENRMVRVKRFEGYYGGRSFLDGIDFVIYPGVGIEGVWADFQQKKLDEMPVYPQIVQKLRSMPDLTWLHRPSLSLLFYGVNEADVGLRDPALLRALSAVIDREKLNTEVYDGQYNPALSILPPGMPGYKPSVPESVDLPTRQADAGLNVTGQSAHNLKRIEVVSGSQSPLAQAELDFVGRAWKTVGVELVPKFIPDWSEFETYVKSNSLQLYRYAWFADIPDPDDFLRILFGSDSPMNYCRFRDKEVDLLFQKAVGETDPIERAKLYQLGEERILATRAVIPLLYLGVDQAYQPTVHGIELSALGAHATSYRHVWLDDVTSK